MKDPWRGFNPDNYSFDEHWITLDAQHRLHAWWLTARDPNAPVVLYLQGARWNLTGSVTRIDRWRQLGFSVFAVDYRGFGKSTDVAPTEAYAYEDAQAAWDYSRSSLPIGALHRRPLPGRGDRRGAGARRPDASGWWSRPLHFR